MTDKTTQPVPLETGGLTDEQIEQLWDSTPDSWSDAIQSRSFARAIESAVLASLIADPADEPDWDRCIAISEEATGLKVERHTISIVIREVRRWLASRVAPQEPDMPAICAALGFDPTNHHNTAKCPYCSPRPAALVEPVARIRTWRKGPHQHADLIDWESAIDSLPEGEHLLYATPHLAPQQAELTQKYDDTLQPFLTLMRKELHANSNKGDRPGWLSMSRNTALLEIYWHTAKLSAAVKNGQAAAISEHAADVANMAMMLLDVCGGLPALAAPAVAVDPLVAEIEIEPETSVHQVEQSSGAAPLSAKSLDDPRLQRLFGDAIEGALAFGFMQTNKPPAGHWLNRFWDIGEGEALRADASPAKANEGDAICPHCRGSGEAMVMSYGHGPDDYEELSSCPHCNGTGEVRSPAGPQNSARPNDPNAPDRAEGTQT